MCSEYYFCSTQILLSYYNFGPAAVLVCALGHHRHNEVGCVVILSLLWGGGVTIDGTSPNITILTTMCVVPQPYNQVVEHLFKR